MSSETDAVARAAPCTPRRTKVIGAKGYYSLASQRDSILYCGSVGPLSAIAPTATYSNVTGKPSLTPCLTLPGHHRRSSSVTFAAFRASFARIFTQRFFPGAQCARWWLLINKRSTRDRIGFKDIPPSLFTFYKFGQEYAENTQRAFAGFLELKLGAARFGFSLITPHSDIKVLSTTNTRSYSFSINVSKDGSTSSHHSPR